MKKRPFRQRIGNSASTASRTAVAILLLAAPLAAQTFDFEDGTGHNVAIPAGQYPGLTFTNAVWISSGSFQNGSFGLGVDAGVVAVNDWAFPGTTSPIVIEIGPTATDVSITAFDVGASGAQLDAFDAADVSIDVDNAVGVGFGGGNNVTLSVTGVGIAKVELTQHLYPAEPNDGVGWDDLVIDPPVPVELLQFAIE